MVMEEGSSAMSSESERVKEYYRTHQEARDSKNEYLKKYQREFLQGGVRVKIRDVWHYVRVPGKRPKPKSCELCGRSSELVYHHWDNTNLLLGMWVCRACHSIIRHIEDGLVGMYLKLKDDIAREIGDAVVDVEDQIRQIHRRRA